MSFNQHAKLTHSSGLFSCLLPPTRVWHGSITHGYCRNYYRHWQWCKPCSNFDCCKAHICYCQSRHYSNTSVFLSTVLYACPPTKHSPSDMKRGVPITFELTCRPIQASQGRFYRTYSDTKKRQFSDLRCRAVGGCLDRRKGKIPF